ncbi:unnamed protein product, partial [Nesidiocoris tenuis]
MLFIKSEKSKLFNQFRLCFGDQRQRGFRVVVEPGCWSFLILLEIWTGSLDYSLMHMGPFFQHKDKDQTLSNFFRVFFPVSLETLTIIGKKGYEALSVGRVCQPLAPLYRTWR